MTAKVPRENDAARIARRLSALAGRAGVRDGGGSVRVEVLGAPGSSAAVDLSSGRERTLNAPVDCLLKGYARDLDALLDGHLAWRDALAVRRLRVAGDARLLVDLFEALPGRRSG